MLAAWWVVNVLQGAFMQLADDEAYYWTWATSPNGLDWGYHDHPPMVALLIWLTSWMGGEIGVRFATLLLQPLYLWLLWRMIFGKGEFKRELKGTIDETTKLTSDNNHPSCRDALAYAAICFAMPALQLYGVMALPDAPLLMFSVLFLWCYKRMLERTNLTNALLLGLSIALLGYSKYHGALVVALALLSYPRLFKRWHTYAALFVALLLLMPHILWQYHHEWTSLAYHLGERHHGFDIENPLMVIVNLLLIFNPLLIPLYWKALRHSHQKDGNGEMEILAHSRYRYFSCFLGCRYNL
ncbi:MAG: glycosyltransferase family 39 protein [Bacteroidales bacterium]|nr:glycosyltransferase family 39 protein [Bacteroidales bacterium]